MKYYLVSALVLLLLASTTFAITDCEICQTVTTVSGYCSIDLVKDYANRTHQTVEWICLKGTNIKSPDDSKLNSSPIDTYQQSNGTITIYTSAGATVIKPNCNILSWNMKQVGDTISWYISCAVPSKIIATKAYFDIYTPFKLNRNGYNIGNSTYFVNFSSNIALTSIETKGYGFRVNASFTSTNGTYTISGIVGKTDVCVIFCSDPDDELWMTFACRTGCNATLGNIFPVFMQSVDALHTCSLTTCNGQVQSNQSGSYAVVPTTSSTLLSCNGVSCAKTSMIVWYEYNYSLKCNVVQSGNLLRSYLGPGTISAEENYNCTILNTAPKIINLVSPANNSNLTSPVNFTFYFQDDQNSTANCSLLVNGVNRANSPTVSNNTNTTFLNIQFNNTGNYTWKVNCSDGLLSNVSVSWNFTLLHWPVVTLVSPVNNSNIFLSQNNLTFYVTDNYSSTLSCSLYINGTLNSTNSSVSNNTNTTFFPNLTTYSNLSWFVDCSNGWFSTQSNTWYFTTIPHTPSITIVSPSNGSILFAPTNFTFYFQDAYNSTAICSLWINNTIWVTNSSTLNNTNTSFLISFNYTVYLPWFVNCSDGITSNVSVTWYFTYWINTPPIVTLIRPSNNSYINASQPFEFHVQDDLSISTQCYVYFNTIAIIYNITVGNNTNTTFYYFSEIYSANNSWYVECIDTSSLGGNSSVWYFGFHPNFPIWFNETPTYFNDLRVLYANDTNTTLTALIGVNMTCSSPLGTYTYNVSNISSLWYTFITFNSAGFWNCTAIAYNQTNRVLNWTTGNIICGSHYPFSIGYGCYSYIYLQVEQSTQCFDVGDNVLIWANVSNPLIVNSLWLFSADNNSYPFSYSILRDEYYIWYRVKQKQEVLMAVSYNASGVATGLGEITVTFNPCPYTPSQIDLIWMNLGYLLFIFFIGGLILVFMFVGGTVLWGILSGRKKIKKQPDINKLNK